MLSLGECSIIDILNNLFSQIIRFTEQKQNVLLQQKAFGENSDDWSSCNKRIEFIDSMSKLINSIIFCMIDNGKINVLFGAFLEMMTTIRRSANYNVTIQDGQKLIPQSNIYNKLMSYIVKCTCRLTKFLGERIDEVSPDLILYKVHLYFEEFGKSANNANTNMNDVDVGLKMIKTIINEMVNIFQEKIWEFYNLIDQFGQTNDENLLGMWIKNYLDNKNKTYFFAFKKT